MGLTGLLAVGIGVQSVGTIASGLAQKAQADKQAELKKEEAKELLRRTDEEIRVLRIQGEKFIGKQTSGFAKSGVDLSGSALSVLEESAASIESEILRIDQAAKFDAEQLRKGGEILKESGRDAVFGGFLGGVGGGIASYAGAQLRTA